MSDDRGIAIQQAAMASVHAELDQLRDELRRYQERPPLTPDCVPVREYQQDVIRRHIVRLERLAGERP